MNESITSTKNDTVKIAKSMHTKKGRSTHQAFLVEGKKCVDELIAHMPDLIRHFFIKENASEDIINKARQTDKHIIFVADHVMTAVCDVKTPQDIAAVASFPQQALPDSGFIVALDGLTDPSNVGTIIRTADAAGCSGVVLSPDCADPISPKALRASMGSLFHLPVARAELQNYLPNLTQQGYHIASAYLSGYTDFSLDWQKTCLVIGNESRGVSESVQKLSTDLIKIPMYGKAESLNAAVAAGILIYQIRT